MPLARRTLLAAALATPALPRGRAQPRPAGWPNGARLAVPVTMMVEADGEQPELMQPGPAGMPLGRDSQTCRCSASAATA